MPPDRPPTMAEQFAQDVGQGVPSVFDIFGGQMLQGANAAASGDTELLRRIGEEIADSQEEGAENRRIDFQLFTQSHGLPADLTNPYVVQAYLNFAQQRYQEEAAASASRSGAAGRTLFPQEAALLTEQAISQRFGRDLERQSFLEAQKEAAFGRATDRMRLLQATDQLLDARRESAMEAALAALPFMVPEGMEFFPGLEPGGVGERLGGLLGANIPNVRIPTMELPLQEMVGAPMQGGPEQIDEALLGLLNAPPIAPPALP